SVMSPRTGLKFMFSFSQSSDVRCGANGLSSVKNVRIADTGIVSAFVNAFTKIIIWEIAVLKENDSISSVTFLVVECMIFCSALSGLTSLSLGDNSQIGSAHV